jgi:DNA-binding NtrC family response regulator
MPVVSAIDTTEWLGATLGALRRAGTFVERADVVLTALLQHLTPCLRGHPLAASAHVLRAGIQLRRDDSVRAWHVVPNPRMPDEARGTAFIPSTPAWRRLCAEQEAIAVDVKLASATVVGTGAQLESDDTRGADVSRSTISRLHSEATHVLVLPVRGVGGAIDGAIWVEVLCTAASGRDFPWTDYARRAQVLADAASAFVTAVPWQRSLSAATDPMLPVVGDSMAGVIDMLRMFAAEDETLLLTGPTGSGKTRLARWCHERWCEANRLDRSPFETHVLAATGAAGSQLSELFGWKKGSFTGAVDDNDGAVLRAEGGTLFLDEIDKISLSAQAGLLQFIDERTYRRLGDPRPRQAKVRLVLGTSANLRAMVRAGSFREDLYYRIHVLPVTVRPLDERRDEIAGWARYMASEHAGDGLRPGDVDIDDDAIALLERTRWPGNLRQLHSVVRRASVLARIGTGPDRRIDLEHVQRALEFELTDPIVTDDDAFAMVRRAAASVAAMARPDRALDFDQLDGFRGLVIDASLARSGSRDETARLLGIKPAIIESRNHHRTLKREQERGRAMLEALGARLGAVVDDDDD